MTVTIRPTSEWRLRARLQRAAVAAGTLSSDDAYALQLWPDDFTAEVDSALDAYEVSVRALAAPSDDDIFAAIERVVRDLNDIDAKHGNIETGEREELCEYIDSVLVAAGIDPEALAARRGIDRAELTDFWRDW